MLILNNKLNYFGHTKFNAHKMISTQASRNYLIMILNLFFTGNTHKPTKRKKKRGTVTEGGSGIIATGKVRVTNDNNNYRIFETLYWHFASQAIAP